MSKLSSCYNAPYSYCPDCSHEQDCKEEGKGNCDLGSHFDMKPELKKKVEQKEAVLLTQPRGGKSFAMSKIQEKHIREVLFNIPTYMLVRELASRPGVNKNEVMPHKELAIGFEGPCIVLEVFD